MIKFLSIVVTVALFALVLPASANAQYWWDGNGTTGGFQVANGDFGTSTFWNTNNSGVGTLTNWPGTTAEARINVNGTINLTVNSAVTAGPVYLGYSPSSGTVTSVNLSGSSTLTATDFSVGHLTVATNSTATASLNQSSGTIVASGTLGVGRNGTTGTWNMSGGSASGAALWIGLDVRGGFPNGTGTVAPSGTMTISGGNMTLSGNVLLGRGAFNAGVAQTADATLNMNSGSLTTTTVSVGFANYSTGTVNLNGGTLTAANVQMASGLTGTTSTFRFNGGTLKSSANSASFMTGLNNAYVDSGGAIIDINGKTNTISQSLLQGTGTAGLTLLSSAAGGQLTLSGTNTYAGATTINGGSLLTLGGRALSDTASVILANAAGANLNVNASETVGGLEGGGTTGGTVNIAASQTLTVTNQATNHTFSGVVAGAGALTKTGNGTLTLVGSNSYTGTTTVNAGTLTVADGNALGSTTNGTTVASGAQLCLTATNSGFTVGAEALTISGQGVTTGGALRNAAGDNTWQGNITMATNATIGAAGGTSLTLDVAAGNAISGSGYSLTFDGQGTNRVLGSISLGAGGITKIGTGRTILAASNSYSGGTILTLGTLTISNANALGSGALIVNGGTLDLGGNNLTAANLSGTGGTISLDTNTLTASMSSGGQFNGTITGSGGLVKTGASFLTLGGSNSYSGGTLVNGGTIFVTGSGTLGDAAGTVTISNAVLDLRNQQTRTGTITMTNQDARIINGGGGSIVNNGNAFQFGGGSLEVPLSGNGGLNVTGGGQITSSNSYTGATTISGTTGWYGQNRLFVGNANALGAASGELTISGGTVNLQSNTITRSGNVTISGGAIENGTLSKTGSAYDIRGGSISTVLSGSAGLSKSTTNGAALNAVNTYTGATTVSGGALNVASGGSIASSATTVDSGATLDVSGAAGAITNSGTTLVRSGGTSGALTVNGGTATVNGTAGNTTINSGGTLLGSGSVSALRVASGGTLAVGNSPGQLNVTGSAEWAGGGIYAWEFASAAGNNSNPLTGQGTNWDFLSVSGVLNIAADSSNKFIIDVISLLALNDTSFNLNDNYSFTIATAAGGITSFLASDFNITGYQATASNNKWSIDRVTNNGGISQSLVLSYTGATAIPEPSSVALTLIGLGVLALRRRFSVR